MRFQALLRASRDGVYLADPAGGLLDVNQEMVDLLGYAREELLGLGPGALFAEKDEYESLLRRIRTDGSLQDTEVRLQAEDGRELTCLLSLVPVESDEASRPEYLGVVRDISERMRAAERARHASLHDSLTQLPNGTAFLDRIERLLERLRHEPEYRFAVLFIDLDNFKLVNDALGHRAGDELLMMVAERLSLLVRPEDIVARFGGDEFTVLLLDLPGDDEAEVAAERVRDGLADEVFGVLEHELYVTTSIGIALAGERYSTAEELIRDADTAMHAAKEEGRGRCAVFDAGLRERTVERFATETELRHALEQSEFVLHYQPLVRIESRSILGFEALLRWNHPRRGLLAPGEFLPVAEETGLIIPIGRWVLMEACRVAAGWRQEGTAESAPVMSVNLSPRQLVHPDLPREVVTALEVTGLPAENLRLEITETILLEHSSAVRKALAELGEMGVWICLDDFGTGYSSLGYLNELRVDVVKIDRSFVREITGLPESSGAEMTGTILSLARRLGVTVVAEGVETEAQREGLIRLGCGLAQGFLFARPLGEVEAGRLLERRG